MYKSIHACINHHFSCFNRYRSPFSHGFHGYDDLGPPPRVLFGAEVSTSSSAWAPSSRPSASAWCCAAVPMRCRSRRRREFTTKNGGIRPRNHGKVTGRTEDFSRNLWVASPCNLWILRGFHLQKWDVIIKTGDVHGI